MQWYFGSASNSRAIAAIVLALLMANGCDGGQVAVVDGGSVDRADAAFVVDTDASDPEVPDGAPARPCTLVLPRCSAPAPSYAADIAPVIARRCLPACHQPGGIEQVQPLTNYAEVYFRRVNVLQQVYHCRMPPADKPELPAEEVTTFLNWLVCGSPNN
jgi:hypothetical protein